jgi:hypothetical protein
MGGAGGSLPATCFNGMTDAGETAEDCGGPCGLCGGEPCTANGECASKLCEMTAGECTTPTCMDGVKNSAETGVDCGPGCSAKCLDNEGCNDDIHCQSSVCENNVCQAPTCMDNTKNGDESGVDCGGTSTCGLCELGQACTQGSDCVSDTCNGNQCSCPAKMIIATAPNMGSYCIDKTEVTYDEYEDFWFAGIPTTNQNPECSWNVNWTPGQNWPQTNSRHPVRAVNWCQAFAYCEWRGKRLCGKFGGGATAYADFDDPSQSQWMNACTANGTNVYPYGQSYQAATCNGADFGEGDTVQVQTSNGQPNTQTTTCQGGSPGLWQMSGNVREWVNACDGTTDENDNCRLRGGSYNTTAAADLACAANDAVARDTVSLDIGFRCCIGG